MQTSPSTAANSPSINDLMLANAMSSSSLISMDTGPQAISGDVLFVENGTQNRSTNRMFGAQLIAPATEKNDMPRDDKRVAQPSKFRSKAIKKEKKLWRTMKVVNTSTGRHN